MEPKLNYKKAFNFIQEDIKLNKCTNLICSAMGCVRNKIPVPIFAKNNVKFHRNTGAENHYCHLNGLFCWIT